MGDAGRTGARWRASTSPEAPPFFLASREAERERGSNEHRPRLHTVPRDRRRWRSSPSSVRARAQAAAAASPRVRATFPVIGARVAVWIAAEVHLCSPRSCSACPCSRSSRSHRHRRQGHSATTSSRRSSRGCLLVAYSATAIWGAVLAFFLTRSTRASGQHMAAIFQPLDVDLRRALLPRIVHALPLLLRLGPLEAGARSGGTGRSGVLLNVWGTIVMFIAEQVADVHDEPARRA